LHYLPPFPTRRSSDLRCLSASSGWSLHNFYTLLVFTCSRTSRCSPTRLGGIDSVSRSSMRLAVRSHCGQPRIDSGHRDGCVPERSEEHTSELQSRVEL